MQYDSDGYNDVEYRRLKKRKVPGAGGSGKRKATTDGQASSKRRRVNGDGGTIEVTDPEALPPVVWRQQSANSVVDPEALKQKLKPFALLQDWRERFRNDKGFPTAVTRDIDSDEGTEPLQDPTRIIPRRTGVVEPVDANDEEEEFEDDENIEDPEEESELAIDPEFLQMALKKNLQSIGLDPEKIDQSMLLEYAQKLLQGSSDDITEQLTDALLNTTEEKTDGFTDWVSQQVDASADTPGEQSDVVEVPIPKGSSNLQSSSTSSQPRNLKRKADSPVSPPRKRPSRHPDEVRAPG